MTRSEWNVLVNGQKKCVKECEGIYADVTMNSKSTTLEWKEKGLEDDDFNKFVEEYLHYKRNFENNFTYFFKDISLNPQWPFINDQIKLNNYTGDDEKQHYSNKRLMEVVKIHFRTPTFDQVTKDARTDLVTKVSLIGGTLGLFTGFSFISGIELIHFLWKIFRSLGGK